MQKDNFRRTRHRPKRPQQVDSSLEQAHRNVYIQHLPLDKHNADHSQKPTGIPPRPTRQDSVTRILKEDKYFKKDHKE